MTKKVLITDDVHPLLCEGLRDDGWQVDYRPEITTEEVNALIHDYEGLIVNSKVYAGKETLDKAVKLKIMGRAGSGLEVFDLEYARQKNIIAFNSPEGNRDSVAEFALGALLNIMRNGAKADNEVRNGKWIREANRGSELRGKTVALMAYGNTARAFAKVLQGFEVNILAYDKYLDGFGDKFVTQSTLEGIFDQADILSLHLPLTTETTYAINYDFLSNFKKSYWLINTSRGKVLRTGDLLRCMDESRILGAALDVLENEKIDRLNGDEKNIFDRLITERRIVLSPHIAGWTHESKRRIAEVLLAKFRKACEALSV